MRTITGKNVKSILALLFFTVSLVGVAQTKKEAVDAFNEGVTLVKTDPDGAIKAFNKCIELSEQLGEEGDETKLASEQQLPLLYYKVAVNNYKKKEFDVAIKAFEESIQVAEKYGNDEISKRSKKIIPQVYYAKGSNEYKNKNFNAAIASLNKAIDLNPNYAKPYLIIGSIYKSMGDFDNMLAACDKAIEVGLATNDKKTFASAEKLARNTMFNQGIASFGSKNWQDAEKYWKKSIEYGNNSPDVYYQLGKMNIAEKKWETAINNLNKAIELDQGEAADKAKYFYELGNAFIGKGDNTQACSSFKKAMFGQYTVNAKYQIEQVLKCK